MSPHGGFLPFVYVPFLFILFLKGRYLDTYLIRESKTYFVSSQKVLGSGQITPAQNNLPNYRKLHVF